MSYHYLVASLPQLFFGHPPPVSCRDFLACCDGVLSRGHLALLAAFLEGRLATGSAFADAWSAREIQLRNAVARFRATRLGVDAGSFQQDHSGYDVRLVQGVAAALTKPTPLEREQGLDQERWRLAEELALADPFGLGTVLAFAVKLRIAERWAALTDAAGRNKIEELMQSLMQSQPARSVGDGSRQARGTKVS